MDSKLPLRPTCAEQIYKDMFTPTYCQCFVLQSQALPASSAIGPYFLASVPLTSIPSIAFIKVTHEITQQASKSAFVPVFSLARLSLPVSFFQLGICAPLPSCDRYLSIRLAFQGVTFEVY